MRLLTGASLARGRVLVPGLRRRLANAGKALQYIAIAGRGSDCLPITFHCIGAGKCHS